MSDVSRGVCHGRRCGVRSASGAGASRRRGCSWGAGRVLAGTVIAGGRAGIGVPGGDLDIAQVNPGIQHGCDECVPRASIRLRVAFMSVAPAAQGGRQRPGSRRAARRGPIRSPAHRAIAASRLNGSCGAQRTVEVSGPELSRTSASVSPAAAASAASWPDGSGSGLPAAMMNASASHFMGRRGGRGDQRPPPGRSAICGWPRSSSRTSTWRRTGRSPTAPSSSSPSRTNPATDPRSAAPRAGRLNAPASGADLAVMPDWPSRTHRRHQEHVPDLRHMGEFASALQPGGVGCISGVLLCCAVTLRGGR